MFPTTLEYADVVKKNRIDVPAMVPEALRLELQEISQYAVYLQDLREAEHRSLASDLHNLIGQSLTSILLSVEIARHNSNLDEVYKALDALKKSVRVAVDDTRKVMKKLRPSTLDDFGAESAIQGLVNESARAGLNCRFESRCVSGQRFCRGVETALYRTVQDYLSDVTVGAGANEIVIGLGLDNHWAQLEINEKGRAEVGKMPIPKREGLSGIEVIQRRIELLQGRLENFTVASDHKRILVSFPVA